MLSLKQLENVCLLRDNDAGTCRYLAQDDNDTTKFYCLKKRPERNMIDQKVAQYIDDCKAKGIDPYTGSIAIGDNCAGFALLKHVIQGYDI